MLDRIHICLFSLLSLSLCSTELHAQATAPVRPKADQPKAAPVARDKTEVKTGWSFLPTHAAKVDDFITEHPTYDGRGVIVMIFDTGVDPGVPGLLTTSDGNVKVIDVRDLSKTGDCPFELAERTGDVLNFKGAHVLSGLNAVGAKAWDSQYYYAQLAEQRFRNGLSDLNFNGSEHDVFGILLYQEDMGKWVAIVDADADKDLTGETKLSNYHEKYDLFSFHSHDSTVGGGRRLNGAVNIYPELSMVSVYFDDGSHGTHVAGIATGHDIDAQQGFNGVAPGAQVIGVKFADNIAGGVTIAGSMQQAFRYAAEVATSQSKPVVVNMSFGIGNELEGSAAMDQWLDSLLNAVPQLTVCVSAGNEGPGLSSVGLPGSASAVITSGAALPPDAARDLYSTYATRTTMFSFSSRGGELAKPDLVSPGTAVSTVPDYVGGDKYNGTSMSSPYTAGCAAVLLSAMRQKYPDWKPNAFAIKRAMMLSADHVDGQTMLDEGTGMIDVPAAFALLTKWKQQGSWPLPVGVATRRYEGAPITTGAYFRAGDYPRDYRQTFTIEPSEPSNASSREKSIGMQAFDLVSDASWMEPVQTSIYRRGSGGMHVDVRYDEKELQKPGLYAGRIWGYEKGRSHTRENARFELWNTVVVPHTFDARNDYRVTVPDISLRAAEIRREFFAIPAGTKAVRLTLSNDGGSSVYAKLFDNEGIEFQSLGLPSDAHTKSLIVTSNTMRGGVWEVDLQRPSASEDASAASATLTVEPILLDLTEIRRQTIPGMQGTLRATVTNPLAEAIPLDATAEIDGYERIIDTTVDGETFELPFSERSGETSVLFEITIPKRDWDLMTDISCMVLRSDSTALYNSAFDFGRKLVPISFMSHSSLDDETSEQSPIAASGDQYRLVIGAGIALPDRRHTWHLSIREKRFVSEPTHYTSSVKPMIAPLGTAALVLRSESPIAQTPPGWTPSGSLYFNITDSDRISVPIQF
jgi:subtilisin family serine protease